MTWPASQKSGYWKRASCGAEKWWDIVAGTPLGIRGTTNFIKLHVVGFQR